MLALVVDFSAHPRVVHPLANTMFQPPHTRLALNGFQASYYSHHKSQSALSETN